MFKFIALLTLCYGIIDVQADYEKYSPEGKKMVENLRATCIEESGANPNDIYDFMKGKFSTAEPFKCYIKCLYTTLGILGDEGYNPDAFLGVMPPHLEEWGKKVTAGCKFEASPNGICDAMYNFEICAYNVSPGEFYLP